MIPHNRVTAPPGAAAALADTLARGQWAQGAAVARLETMLAARAGQPAAVAVGSGLGALRLALAGLGVGSGDEVIVPAYSCVALANAALSLGARPVTADVRYGDWVLDPPAVRGVLGPRTRAIIAVHTFGAPAPIAALRELLPTVIEDCAHGLGTASMGRLAPVAITSFYATKLIGAGEGGALMSSDTALHSFVAASRDYSDQPPDGRRLNDKMTDLAATIAQAQLASFDANVAERQRLAARYETHLRPLAEAGHIGLPEPHLDRVWYRYSVLVRDRAAAVVAALARLGVGAAEPVADWRTANVRGEAPVADQAYARLVSLPLYPSLTEHEQDRVIAAVEAVV